MNGSSGVMLRLRQFDGALGVWCSRFTNKWLLSQILRVLSCYDPNPRTRWYGDRSKTLCLSPTIFPSSKDTYIQLEGRAGRATRSHQYFTEPIYAMECSSSTENYITLVEQHREIEIVVSCNIRMKTLSTMTATRRREGNPRMGLKALTVFLNSKLHDWFNRYRFLESTYEARSAKY